MSPYNRTVVTTKAFLADELANFAVEAAQSVVPYLRAAAGTVSEFNTKRDLHDPVTVHDRAVENLLKDFLGATVPGSRFLGEEMGEEILPGSSGSEPLGEGATYLATRVRWIVDPIDGTANFASGSHYFGTSIGVELDGQVVAGVISTPMTSEIFAANLEEAWLIDAEGRRSPLRSSGPALESQAAISTYYPGPRAFLGDKDAASRRFIELSDAYMAIRRLGAGAVDLAHVAAGRLSCVLGVSFAPWDVAAGIHLVQVAGGHTVNVALGTSHPEGLRPAVLAYVEQLEPTVALGVLQEIDAES